MFLGNVTGGASPKQNQVVSKNRELKVGEAKIVRELETFALLSPRACAAPGA